MGHQVFMLQTQSPAHQGAALLDKRFPDWFTRINLDRFTISSGRHCVLGQLYGSVERGWPLLCAEISHDSRFDARQALIEYGFSATTIGGYEKNLHELNNAWLTEIDRRIPGILCEKAIMC